MSQWNDREKQSMTQMFSNAPALYYLILEVRLFYSSSKECIYTKVFMSGADFTEDFVGKMKKEI